MIEPSTRQIVESLLNARWKCLGHCDQQTGLKFIEGEGDLIACHVCPGGYVSRVVVYGRKVDLAKFKGFIAEAAREVSEVGDEDIRVATRYAWDLGLESTGDGAILREAYWSQNYRGRKNADPNRIALFLCRNCNSFYRQPANSENTFCDDCRGRTR